MILVNGRFTLRQPTGVDVHAHEVTRRLAGLDVITPPQPCASGLLGHAWEQTALAGRSRRRVLWSPCNTGPLRAGRHVITVHDVSVFDRPEFFSRRYRLQANVLSRVAKRHAELIITVSEFSKGRIVECLGVPAERVRVVGNGVRTEILKLPPTDTGSAEPAGFVTVGSIEPRKGLHRLVDAYRRSGSPSPLRIIGKSDPRVYAAADLESGAGMSALGYVSTDRMIEEIRRASAFFYLSAYEGFGMPPVEAAALGVPVVVSDIAAHREVLGGLRGIRFVSTADDIVSAMADADRGHLERPEPAEVRLRHSWDAVAEAYRCIFADEFGDPDVAIRTVEL